MKAGALGGKLLGAGGGGFMIFYVPTGKMGQVSQALSRFSQVPFRMSSRGAHVMASAPQLYSDYYDALWEKLEPQGQ